MGEALGHIKRERLKRQEKERVQAALVKVLEAGLKGFGGFPPGQEAALLAAAEHPAALSHPNFQLIMHLIRQR